MTRPIPPQAIASWESLEEDNVFKSKVYDDGSGNPTQGFGHTGPEVRFGGPDIGRAQADAWVAQDLTEAQQSIDHLVKVTLNDNQDSALLTFTGNAGGTALATSTLLRKLNASDYQGAADEFLKWTYARNLRTGKLEYSAGLATRRAKERAMFLAPSSAPVTPPIPTPRPEWMPPTPDVGTGPTPDVNANEYVGTSPPPLSQSTTIWSAVSAFIASGGAMVLSYVQSPYALVALAMVLVFAFFIIRERTKHRAIAGV